MIYFAIERWSKITASALFLFISVCYNTLCCQSVWASFIWVCFKTFYCLLVRSIGSASFQYECIMKQNTILFFPHHLSFSDFNNSVPTNQQHTKTNQKHLSGKLQYWESSDNGLSLAYETGSRSMWQYNGQGSPLFRLWPCYVIKRRFVQMAVIQGLKDKIGSQSSKKR